MAGQVTAFGQTAEGRSVEKIRLRRGAMEAEIITLGATLTAMRVPAPSGEVVDVVLGFTSPGAYEAGDCYLGATVGRVANRTAGAVFTLDGVTYSLVPNEGTKQLHGGPGGFSRRVFALAEAGESAARLTYTSAHGEEGYPGRLTLSVTYALTEEGLSIRYRAETDRSTVVNPTNHSYFNLNGGGSVLGHRLRMGAEAFTPVGEDSLPLARAMAVEGTPFDFREEKPLGRDIEADHIQLRHTGGYDHSFWIPGEGFRLAARLTGDLSGIVMEAWTDMPAVQLYAGNFLHGDQDTKTGMPYGPREAVCLETQFPPDGANHLDWCPGIVLRPGEKYDHVTEYRFPRH